MMSVDEKLVADQLAKKRKPIVFDLDADDAGAADVALQMDAKSKTSPLVAIFDDDVVELPSLDFDKSLSAVIEAKKPKSGSEPAEASSQQMSKRPRRRQGVHKTSQTAKGGKVDVAGKFTARATNEKLSTINRRIKERKQEQNKIQSKITMSRGKRGKPPGILRNYQDRKQPERSPAWKTAFGGFQNEQVGGDLFTPGQSSSFSDFGMDGFGSSTLGPQPNFVENQRPLPPPPPRVNLPPPGVAFPTMVMPPKPVQEVKPRDQFAFAPPQPPKPAPYVYQKAPFDGRRTSNYQNFKPPMGQRGNFDSFQGLNSDPRFDDCNDEPYPSERRSVDPRYQGGDEMANSSRPVGRQIMDDFARIRRGPGAFDDEVARGIDFSRIVSMPPKEMLQYVQKCSQDYADELDRRYPDVRKVMGRLVKTMVPDGCGGMKVGNVVPCDVYNQDNSCRSSDLVHFDENGARRIHSCAVCYFSLGGMINLHRQGFCPLLSIVK